jgi:uncharacterized protein YprB with RNaseH-like and TPR domain
MIKKNESPAKICLFDIECTNLNANFGYILCVGYKWFGEKKNHIISITDSPTWDTDPTNDKWVVSETAKVLNQADILVGWYSSKFDFPYLQSKLLMHGLKPMPPIPHVDGWRISRYKMKLTSNRLATVTSFFGLEDKTPLNGPIWIKAAAGHKPSINYVIRHCRQDVEVLEQVYNKIRPLCTTHPNVSIALDDTSGCPICGSSRVHKRGFSIARTCKRQRYQCMDCGGWSSGKPIAIAGEKIR